MSKLYRQWVTTHQHDAWSLARHLLRNDSEAEDATQEAFVSLWTHRNSVDPARVKPWLMRVLRNECFDRLRRRRPEVDLDESETETSGGPMLAIQQEQLSNWLMTAITSLAEPYRSLVVLRDIQQLSYEAVGETLNLSLPQVKVYLHRARKDLREQLRELRP
jgi:RNA polymerase sigma-70 factor (ECF subfamily)